MSYIQLSWLRRLMEFMRRKLKREPRITMRHLHKHVLDLHDVAVQILENQHSLSHKVNSIMATQAQLASDLAAVTAQVTKIGTETTTLLQKITELEAVIAAGGGTTPEVDAALEALKVQAKVVDDLVTDTAP